MEVVGKQDRLERLQEVAELTDIHYAQQRERNGLGDAVQYASNHRCFAIASRWAERRCLLWPLMVIYQYDGEERGAVLEYLLTY